MMSLSVLFPLSRATTREGCGVIWPPSPSPSLVPSFSAACLLLLASRSLVFLMKSCSRYFLSYIILSEGSVAGQFSLPYWAQPSHPPTLSPLLILFLLSFFYLFSSCLYSLSCMNLAGYSRRSDLSKREKTVLIRSNSRFSTRKMPSNEPCSLLPLSFYGLIRAWWRGMHGIIPKTSTPTRAFLLIPTPQSGQKEYDRSAWQQEEISNIVVGRVRWGIITSLRRSTLHLRSRLRKSWFGLGTAICLSLRRSRDGLHVSLLYRWDVKGNANCNEDLYKIRVRHLGLTHYSGPFSTLLLGQPKGRSSAYLCYSTEWLLISYYSLVPAASPSSYVATDISVIKDWSSFIIFTPACLLYPSLLPVSLYYARSLSPQLPIEIALHLVIVITGYSPSTPTLPKEMVGLRNYMGPAESKLWTGLGDC